MIKFTKMHGLGNDYVYVNCFEQSLEGLDVAALARAMSDRHQGIGADGLILIRPADEPNDADVRMEMYNADGSRAEMCGNGIRCVAKYVLDHGVVDKGLGDRREIRIQTDGGVRTVSAMLDAGRVHRVRVDLGVPSLGLGDDLALAPGAEDGKSSLELEIGDQRYRMTLVSMGNPHAVMFVDAVDAVDLGRLGPSIERHAMFPNHVNFHIFAVQSRCEATMRSWERGSGLTQACGTGAGAVLVAGVLEGRLDRSATIHLPGGDLMIDWKDSADGLSGSVYMTGPAVEVYSGQWPT